MRLTEEFLQEATFDNYKNLLKHYQAHVLQPGEKFDENNPKFPYMSIHEYAERAKILSLEKAGTSEDRDSPIIGFEIEDGRKVKIKKRSNLFSRGRYPEIVMYVTDDEKHYDAIITYYLGRPTKLFNLKKQFVKELDENIDNSDFKYNE